MTYVYTCSTMIVLCGGTQIWYMYWFRIRSFFMDNELVRISSHVTYILPRVVNSI